MTLTLATYFALAFGVYLAMSNYWSAQNNPTILYRKRAQKRVSVGVTLCVIAVAFLIFGTS